MDKLARIHSVAVAFCGVEACCSQRLKCRFADVCPSHAQLKCRIFANGSFALLQCETSRSVCIMLQLSELHKHDDGQQALCLLFVELHIALQLDAFATCKLFAICIVAHSNFACFGARLAIQFEFMCGCSIAQAS